jgi:hypothetical protein
MVKKNGFLRLNKIRGVREKERRELFSDFVFLWKMKRLGKGLDFVTCFVHQGCGSLCVMLHRERGKEET